MHLVHYRALLPNSRSWVRAKSLAVQTAKATENVAGQIAAVQELTTTAVAAIGRIAERMQEINEDTSSVAASVHQQDAVTGEISHNVGSAAEGTTAIASIVQRSRGRGARSQPISADAARSVGGGRQHCRQSARRGREVSSAR